MTLPNVEKAVLPEAKLTKYLLSTTHEDGKGKAGFFTSFGFSVDAWGELAKALLQHVMEHGIVTVEDTQFGTRYVAEGPMNAVDGRKPNLRSVGSSIQVETFLVL